MNPVAAVRSFLRNLGPVEQAQIVASTAVIVSMGTIISAMVVTGQSPRLMDFISILTVGLIGYVSVYFSLQYSRQLDEQRRQLMALYNIVEAVSRVAELDVVLRTALDKMGTLLNTRHGWVYLLEGDRLTLTCSQGTDLDFFSSNPASTAAPSAWLNQPRVERERPAETTGRIGPALKALGIQFWASVPLKTKDAPAGVLIVAGESYDIFTPKQAELMEAFGNHISVAISNARLFERLRQSEQRYLDLFENAPDMYLSVDRRHRIVGCNTTGASMLGSPREAVVGLPFESLFVESRRDNVRAAVDAMFTDGRGLRDMEEQMRGQNGQTFFVNLNSSLVFDETGATVNARIVARDISDRKKMEGAILHAQKIDSIGNLAGGVAHDFNNILSAILGSASIMRRHLPEKAKFSKYVEIIESSARRGSSLTRQLLTFARKTETFIKPVNINQLIGETLTLFERSVSKEIRIVTSLSEQGAVVNGDDGQIQQALLNLFLNARDAMPEGGTLTISTSLILADAHTPSQFSSVKPGPFVVIQVSDTGHGIAREMHNRVFEPFFTTKDHGTGLGLSVVYGVVQAHGGFINLESSVGKGTTFSLYLPRVTVTSRTEERRRRIRLPHGTERVLIIEDEVSVAEIASDMLSGLGYTTHIAGNGREGLAFYRTRRADVDLILLDINMPEMGGKEAFELLRAENPAVPIIIVTGYGRDTLETSSFSSAVDAFMEKPFQLETMALTVRQVLDKRIPQPAPVS